MLGMDCSCLSVSRRQLIRHQWSYGEYGGLVGSTLLGWAVIISAFAMQLIRLLWGYDCGRLIIFGRAVDPSLSLFLPSLLPDEED